ncbi:MAG: DUF2330 domain-containing protein [Candidatus Eisenbacteria bacterium]|uniref:DUF2330 domain-containing protein n=1 Tax=Eiseniibacteriota bacterium TaxID=2212470 RepID=A0A538SUD5_UNCEI|nr:MAG: DUF2330 domain-containing protein [Candidatus Eisenbacteria bacterium]
MGVGVTHPGAGSPLPHLPWSPHSAPLDREARTMDWNHSVNRSLLPLVRIPLTFLLLTASAPGAFAFCGFYVAQGDAKLYNHSSKVVLARDGDRTVLTMASDFQGDPKEFAVVIPVPVVLKKEQVHVGDPGLVDRLHDYSVPRLVEYWDPNPCPEESHFRGGTNSGLIRKDSSSRQMVTSEDLRSPSPKGPPACCRATSNRACISSWPR